MNLLVGPDSALARRLAATLGPTRRVAPAPGGWSDVLAATALLDRAPVSAVVHLAAHGGELPHRLAALRGAAALAERAGAPMILVSSLGTVAGARHADVRPEEDAPYGDGGGLPVLADLVRVEREARALARRRDVALTVVRVPLLLAPDDEQGTTAGALLDLLAHPDVARLPGGVHLGDVRDAADGIARVLARPERRPVYHLPGTALPVAELAAMAREVGLASRSAGPLAFGRPSPVGRLAFARARLGAALRRPSGALLCALGRHWGAGSLYAAELGHRPRGLRQTLVDLRG